MSDKKEIVILLDESGSMLSMGNEPIEAINEFISEQKNTLISLWTFNTNVKQVFDKKPSIDIDIDLSDNFYNPNGMTALDDSIGKSIRNVGDKKNVTFLIITDGKDNSSKDFSRIQIKKIIKEKINKLEWDFIFLGANINAFDESTKLGINKSFQIDETNSLLKLTRHVSQDLNDIVSASAATPLRASETRAELRSARASETRAELRSARPLRKKPKLEAVERSSACRKDCRSQYLKKENAAPPLSVDEIIKIHKQNMNAKDPRRSARVKFTLPLTKPKLIRTKTIRSEEKFMNEIQKQKVRAAEPENQASSARASETRAELRSACAAPPLRRSARLRLAKRIYYDTI